MTNAEHCPRGFWTALGCAVAFALYGAMVGGFAGLGLFGGEAGLSGLGRAGGAFNGVCAGLMFGWPGGVIVWMMSTNREGRRLWVSGVAAFLIAGVAVFLAATWVKRQESAHPFAGRHIVRIEAMLEDFMGRPGIARFEVPAQHIPAILACLEPMEPDRMPAGWVAMGHLQCVCDDGATFGVALYWSRQPAGAFSVSGRYFRGGNDECIQNAIRAAYAARK